jgi:methyl-accepting chemotaxis protein
MTQKNAENSRASAGHMTGTSRMVADANQRLVEMKTSMHEINTLVDGVQNGSTEQAHGVEQIAKTLTETQQLTERLAAKQRTKRGRERGLLPFGSLIRVRAIPALLQFLHWP